MERSEATSLKLGTRKSQLAMIQTNFVKDQLNGRKCEIIAMSTKGDEVLDKALSKIGEKSLFTKELEIALELGQVDAVVHSLKDLPTTLPDGLVIGAVCKRASPYDAVLMRPDLAHLTLATLPPESVIGTSSVRRAAHLKAKYPHLSFKDVRGNLNTRLAKLDSADHQYAALILAEAGVDRMGWHHRVTQVLSDDYYATGQGAVAVECRADDLDTQWLLSGLTHVPTALCCVAERALMATLEGGCSVPLGVHCDIVSGELHIRATVYSLDGSQQCGGGLQLPLPTSPTRHHPGLTSCSSILIPTHTERGLMADKFSAAEKAGVDLAQLLLHQGAKHILDGVRS